MKKLLTFFLMALLTFSVGWAATETDVLNRAFTGITGTGYSNFSGKTGTSGAVYAGNCAGGNTSIQLRSTSASGIVTTTSGGKVKSITVVWNSNTASGRTLTVYGKNSAYSSSGDLYDTSTRGTVLGTIVYGTSTTLTINGDYEYIGFRSASNALYLTSVSIVWEAASSSSVEAPTISPNGGNFATSQQVTLSQADADAIYYTLDGNDPTTSSTQYTAPFTINATTTVKAIAVKDGVSSAVASATFTKVGVGTIAEAYAVPQGSTFIFTSNVVVTYQNGRNVWIRDNSGSGLIYRKSGETSTFNNGDILDVNWSATNTTYNEMIPEFSNPSGVTSSSNGGTVAPFDRTSTGITTANVNEYVSFSNVTLSWDSSVGYCYYAVGNNRIYFRNNYFYNDLSVSSGNTYNIEGIAYIEKKNNTNISVVYLTKVTAVSPVLTVNPTELTINDSGTNNTFTVEGSNLGYDNVGLTQSGSNFSPSLSATTGDTYYGDNYLGFSPDNGSVNGTVAMSYTGRDLSASETVTLANNVANASVTVNYRADVYVLGNYGSGWDYTNGILMTYDATNNTYTASVTVNAGNLIVFARKLGLNEDNSWNTRYLFGPNSGGDWWVNGDNAAGTIDLYDDDPIYFVNGGTYIVTINANTGALTVAKEVVNEGDFVLVTDVDQLNTGDEVIFVNRGSQGDGLAMSTTQNSNNRGTTDVTVTPALKVTATATTQIATLEGDATGWYFNVGNGYLYAASSGSNYLRTEAAPDANGNAKAAITIGSGNVASIVFQGSNTRNVMQFNGELVSCYGSASQSPVYLYRRGAIAEPSITVNPTSLDLVIPAGSTSVDGTVAVTETNTTGTTSVSINGDTDIFSATLDNGTLTVTYSGTATQANPDQATITLTNGTATATVTVTGYKVPMTVTITPDDGHTFSTSTVTGIIESNVADALIEYSFDGNSWITYDPDEGFTTPEVANVGGTVTVYARATYNGETTTSQVTYTRVEESMTCTAEIVFDPTSDNGGVTTWETLQTHMSEGTDYISDAEMATVYTSNDYDSFRFGSKSNVGHMTFTLKPRAFTGGAVKLTKVTINAARYSDDTGCELNVSTDVNTTGVTQAITAAQTDFDYYVFNFDGSEISTLTIKNLAKGNRVYVHSITLEYNCEISLTLADLVADGVENKKYTITDELQVAKVTWDDNQHKFAIFAKDDEMYADKSYPTDGMDSYLIEYANQDSTFINVVPQENYDQSNWIEILIPNSNVTTKASDAYESELADLQTAYENKILKAGQVRGTYINALNPTIVMTTVPEVESSSEYSPNYYCPGNFLMENLDTDGAQSYRTDDLAGGSYFMMEPKPQEFCKVVWAYFDGVSSYFVAAEREGDLINGLRLRGSFKADMSLCEDKNVTAERSVSECFAPSNTNSTTSTLYGFNAIVRKVVIDGNQANGAPHRIAPYSDGMEDEPTYIVYPLNSGTTSHENVTNVDETLVTKTVVSVHYYNMMGMESRTPFDGINVVVTRYSDGSTSTLKVIK